MTALTTATATTELVSVERASLAQTARFLLARTIVSQEENASTTLASALQAGRTSTARSSFAPMTALAMGIATTDHACATPDSQALIAPSQYASGTAPTTVFA